MALEKAGLQAVVEGLDGYVRDLKKMSGATADLNADLKAGSTHAASLGKTVAGTALGFTAYEVATKAIGTAFKFGVGNAIEFEHGIDAVGAIAGATDSELAGLSKTALRIGADTAFSASQAVVAMQELAANGISTTDIMGGAADAVAALAAAGGTSLPLAADTVSTAMSVWGLSTDDMTDAVNRLAGAANVSRFGVEDMSQAVATGGGAAAAAGVEFGDFNTTIAAIAPLFTSGADAGTSFKTFVTRLTPVSNQARDAMKELGLITEDGANKFFDAQGKLKSMAEVTDILHEATAGLSEQQRLQAFSTIFGTDSMRAAIGVAKLTGEEFEAMDKKMREADAAEIAKQRMDNLSGRMESLKGSVETLGINIGLKLIPALTSITDVAITVVNAFDKLPSGTQNILLLSAAVAGAIPIFSSLIPKVLSLVVAEDAEAAAANRARLAHIGLGLAIVGVVVAVDELLRRTTGHGLLENLLGTADDADRAEEAAKAVKRVLDSVSSQDAPAKVKALSDQFHILGMEWDTLNKRLEAGPQNWKEYQFSMAGVRYESKLTEEKVRQMAAAMKEQGATAGQMHEVYAQLPPDLQKVFDSATGVVVAYQHLNDVAEQDALKAKLADMAQKDVADTLKQETTPALTGAAAEFDALALSMGDAEKGTRDYMKALDELIGRFADANPEVAALQANNAFLQETIDDIKASTDNLSPAQQKQIDLMQAQIDANAKQIDGYSSNQKALEGAKAALVNYMGPEGLGTLLTVMSDLKTPQEDQIFVLGQVNTAYRTLTTDGVPAALGAFEQLKTKLSPQVWDPIAKAIGPGLVAKITEGYTGEERTKLLTAAGKLGFDTPTAIGKAIDENKAATIAGQHMMDDALGAMSITATGPKPKAVGTDMAAGVAAGLAAAQVARIVSSAAESLVGDALAKMKAKAEVHSPSEWTRREVGRPTAEGVAKGIEDEHDGVVAVGIKFVDDVLSGIASEWEKNGTLVDTSIATTASQWKASVAVAFDGVAAEVTAGWAKVAAAHTLAGASVAAGPGGLPGGGSPPLGTPGSPAPPGYGGTEPLVYSPALGRWVPLSQAPETGLPEQMAMTSYIGAGLYKQLPLHPKVGDVFNGMVWTGSYWSMGGATPIPPGFVGKGMFPTWSPGMTGIAGYDRGTPYVPQTGLALLHKGERVIPAEDNTRWGTISNYFDLTGSQFTGTPEANEAMMRRVFNESLTAALGRDAIVSGVR